MESSEIDVLVIGAGPAGLAAAIGVKRRLAEQNRSASVVIIEKAPKVGYHLLSGAIFEHDCLDELLPDWRSDGSAFVKDMLQQTVQDDSIHFLTRKFHARIPGAFLPAGMKHQGETIISICKLAEWLSAKAVRLGVEIYTGFAARDVLVENGVVRGVVLAERGVDRLGNRLENYMPEEIVRAKVVILADGSFGPVSRRLTEQFQLNRDKMPQVYSLGVKQLIKLPENNNFGRNRVVHTLGYPNKWDVFGGGFVYDMGNNVAAVGVVLGLDWRYFDLSPQGELELYKEQPFIRHMLYGGEVVAAGAKTIPEGGYFAMPRPHADGAILIGDAAGLVNMAKIKGLHLAIKSGIAAAQTVVECLAEGSFSSEKLASYNARLEAMGVIREMYHARNLRQGFSTPLGIFLGAPLSTVQHLMPFKLGMRADREHASRTSVKRKYHAVLDRKTFVGLSGAMHDEELRPHIRVFSAEVCRQCIETLGAPCMAFCPGQVYTYSQNDSGVTLSPADCMHCKTCAIKCPLDNVDWVSPDGGYGPKFRQM